MKINIVITVTVAFSLCQGRHVGVYIGREGDAERDWPWPHIVTSAANRLIGEVVQSRRRPLLGPSPG